MTVETTSLTGAPKMPDLSGFRDAMQKAKPGKKFRRGQNFREAVEITREARARGVPWPTIAAELKAHAIDVSFSRLRRALSGEKKRREDDSSAGAMSASNSAGDVGICEGGAQ